MCMPIMGVPPFNLPFIDDTLIMFTAVCDILPPPSHPRRPEHALMLAVLEQALHDLHRTPLKSAPPKGVSLRTQALEWFRSNESEWPLAFLRVAEVFGLDVDAVRARVDRIQPHTRIRQYPRRSVG